MTRLRITAQIALRGLLPLLIARGSAAPADQYALAWRVGGLGLFYAVLAASLVALAVVIARVVDGPSSSPHLGRAAAVGADIGYCFSGWVLALLVAIWRPAAADADMAWYAAVALMLATTLVMRPVRWSAWNDSPSTSLAKIPAETPPARPGAEPMYRAASSGERPAVLGRPRRGRWGTADERD
jgi:hypothetical protein